MRQGLIISAAALAVGLGGYALWELAGDDRADEGAKGPAGPAATPKAKPAARPRPTRPKSRAVTKKPVARPAPPPAPPQGGDTDEGRLAELDEAAREREVREELWRKLEALEEPTVDEGARLIHEAMQKLHSRADGRPTAGSEAGTGTTGR